MANKPSTPEKVGVWIGMMLVCWVAFILITIATIKIIEWSLS